MASLGDSVVLFVADFDSDVTDTWVFDGTTWSHPTQTVPPVALFGFGSATLDGLVLLYGGYSGSVGTGQDRTFSWNGSTWQDLGPAAAPSSFASGSTPCLMATLRDALHARGSASRSQRVDLDDRAAARGLLDGERRRRGGEGDRPERIAAGRRPRQAGRRSRRACSVSVAITPPVDATTWTTVPLLLTTSVASTEGAPLAQAPASAVPT